jgi:hypothetical protein
VDLFAGRIVKGVLQRVEIGHALCIQHDDLAIEPAGSHSQGFELGGESGHPVGPVVAAPRDQPRLAALDARQDPVTVELRLHQPAAAGGRGGGQGRELGLEAGRQRGLHGLREVRLAP